MKLNNLLFGLFLIMAVLVSALVIVEPTLAAEDDWVFEAQQVQAYHGGRSYQPPSVWEQILDGFFIFAIPLLGLIAYLTINIILIVQGARRTDKSRMWVGISLLVYPFILFGLIALFMAVNSPGAGLLIGVFLTFGVVITGLIFTSKKAMYLAIAPLVLLLLIGLLFPIAYFGVLSPTRMLSSGSSMDYSSRAIQNSAMAESASGGNLGFSVGGAKDMDNFRKNIENDFLPIPTDITYEGLFYDYYFDTGLSQECTDLFCPSYTTAISADPLSGEEEYYLSVGLNSNIKAEDFERKKLNLVVVMDISGSMGSPFNRYYYDQQYSNPVSYGEEEPDFTKTKMEIANENVVALLDHLGPDDRFGMVLFESQAYLAKPLNKVEDTDMEAIAGHIMDVRQTGGTNMGEGIKKGTELFEEIVDADKDEYENRIIFITDAMPNTGMTREGDLFGIAKDNADDGIHTTFIGVGVDFNTELVEIMTKIRGANYYSVHSSTEFQKRLDEEFEFMVTPIVFDLLLEVDADGFEIEKVYGSPEADEATGTIMKVNTLFPSATTEEGTRGGIVVLKLKKLSEDASLTLSTSYEDRGGREGESQAEVIFPSGEHFDNTGIRKAILLSRYVNVMKNWVQDERATLSVPSMPDDYEYRVNYEDGIVLPPVMSLGRWERQSSPLMVSEHYQEVISDFKDHFEDEMAEIGDEELEQEVELMEAVLAS